MGHPFRSPEWYVAPMSIEQKSQLAFVSKNDNRDMVPRFMAQVVEGVTVKKSPVWLQAGLTRVGIRPINSIVDLTNYYMHLTAQPTHAFDYDKIKKLSGEVPTIFPRMANNGETIELLNGKTVKLTSEDIVIATDKRAIALAGVMGGADTEVDESTANIVIECATFDMYTIRRTAMRHGLFTDAVTRFNKGQSPLQNDRVLAKMVSDITEDTGAMSGLLYDSGKPSKLVSQLPITIPVDFINERLGLEFTVEGIKTIMENVECAVEVDKSRLTIKPPFWRMDLRLPEDIVEEVGRLHGYDKLPVALPVRSSRPAPQNRFRIFKQSLRKKLVQAGANELLTYSFVHGDLIIAAGGNPQRQAYHLRNALSPDLQYYRTALLPSILSKVHPNSKAQAGAENNEFVLFELGKTHLKGVVDQDGLPQEFERLALVVSADGKASKDKYGSAYYQARHYLDYVTSGHADYRPLEIDDDPLQTIFLPSRSAVVSLQGIDVGVIGEFSTMLRKTLKLPEYCAGFEVDVTKLEDLLKPHRYTPLSVYPESKQDMTFQVFESVSFREAADCLRQATDSVCSAHQLSSRLEYRDIYSESDKKIKRFSFRIIVSHPNRTLTTGEFSGVLEDIAAVMHEKLAADRV
jgi:phenylalanyl-tRNA synthetase beta chain